VGVLLEHGKTGTAAGEVGDIVVDGELDLQRHSGEAGGRASKQSAKCGVEGAESMVEEVVVLAMLDGRQGSLRGSKAGEGILPPFVIPDLIRDPARRGRERR
jgi:hypothetical protein